MCECFIFGPFAVYYFCRQDSECVKNAMATPVLATKLHFPLARPTIVPRPRLVALLQAGLQCPLTVISAPAGYGKTSLLSEWRLKPGKDYPTAWLSLDERDNDV